MVYFSIILVVYFSITIYSRGAGPRSIKVLSFYIGINVFGLHIPIEITIHLTESASLQDCQQSIFVPKKLDMG